MNEDNKAYAQNIYAKIATQPNNTTPFHLDAETKHRWSLTGIRHIIAINEQMGTPTTDKEWADMSIR